MRILRKYIVNGSINLTFRLCHCLCVLDTNKFVFPFLDFLKYNMHVLPKCCGMHRILEFKTDIRRKNKFSFSEEPILALAERLS